MRLYDRCGDWPKLLEAAQRRQPLLHSPRHVHERRNLVMPCAPDVHGLCSMSHKLLVVAIP
jgi:hypothetical protein